MSFRYKSVLAILLILAAVAVWAVHALVWLGKPVTEHPVAPFLSHAQIAGPAVVKADADELEATYVTPHLEYEIKGNENVLWCATFQIAWNELCELLGVDFPFKDSSEMVRVLNKKTVTRADLDETSYIAMAGFIRDDIVEKIEKALEEKFQGQASPELLEITRSLPPDFWIAYAYLFKYLPYEHAFARLRKHRPLKFAGCNVESFGIVQFRHNDPGEAKAAEQVLIYDFKNEDDFIIELKTRSKSDRLILAKIQPAPTLAETIRVVQKRIDKSQPTKIFPLGDLRIPILDFDVFRNYEEISWRDILLQRIRFKLDEKGAVLLSEGLLARNGNKDIIFDKPFLIMIQRTDAQVPYFALWVANSELLVPFGQKG